jgi:hypothetical protein
MLTPSQLCEELASTQTAATAALSKIPAVADYSGTLTAVQPVTALIVTLLQRCDAVLSPDEVDAAVMEGCASTAACEELKQVWGPQAIVNLLPTATDGTPSLELDDDDDDEEEMPLSALKAKSGRTQSALASLQPILDSQEEDAPDSTVPAASTRAAKQVSFATSILPGARSVLEPVRQLLREILQCVLKSASLSKAQKAKQGWSDASWSTILKQLVTDVCILLGHPAFPAAVTLCHLLQRALGSTLPSAGQEPDKILAPIQPLTIQLTGMLLARLQTLRATVDALPLLLASSTAEVDVAEAESLSRRPPLAVHANTAVAASNGTKAAALLPFTLHCHAGALHAWLYPTDGAEKVWSITSGHIKVLDASCPRPDAVWMVQTAAQTGIALQLSADAHRDPSAVAALRTWYSWWLHSAMKVGNLTLCDYWRAAVDNLESSVISMSSDSRASRSSNAQRLRLGFQGVCFSNCFASWEKQLKQILAIMSVGSVQARKKALETLKTLVQVQPALLTRPAVRLAMRQRLQDKSISVRAATVELLGQHILQDPSLASNYADVLLTKLHDSGLSVRKSAVNTLHKLLVAGHCSGIEIPGSAGKPAVQLDTAVLHAMLERASDSDEEEAMRDLVASTVDQLWFGAPEAQSDVAVATDLQGRSEQLVQLMQLSVASKVSNMDALESPEWLCAALREAIARHRTGKKSVKRSRSTTASNGAPLELSQVPALVTAGSTGNQEAVAVRGLAARKWGLPSILPALVTGVVELMLRTSHGEVESDTSAEHAMTTLVASAGVLQAFATTVPQAVVPHTQVLVQYVSLVPCLGGDGALPAAVDTAQKLLATRVCAVFSSALPLLSVADTSYTASLQSCLSSVLAVQKHPLAVPNAALMHAAASAWGALISQVMAATPSAFSLPAADRPDAVLRVQLWLWWSQCRKMREILETRVPDIERVPEWLSSLQIQSPWTYMRVAVALYGMGLLVRSYNFDYLPDGAQAAQQGGASEDSVVHSEGSGTNATPTTLAQAAAVQSACSDMPAGTVAPLVVDEYSVWSDVPHAHLAVQAMRGLGFVLCRHPALLAEELFSNILQESLLPSVHPDVRTAALQAMGDVLSAREAAAIAGQGISRHIARLQASSDAGDADTSTSVTKAHAAAALGSGGSGPANDHSVIPAFVLKCLPLVRSGLCAGEQPHQPVSANADELHAMNRVEAARLRFAAVTVLCGVGERGVLHTEQVLPSLLAACGDSASKVRQVALKGINTMCNNKPRAVQAAFADGLFGAFIVSKAAAGPSGVAASPLLAAGHSAEEGGSRMHVVCDALYTAYLSETPSIRQAMFRRVLRRFDASIGAQSSLAATSRASSGASDFARLAAADSADDDDELEQWATEIAFAGQDALAEGMRSVSFAPPGTDGADMAPYAAAAVKRGASLDLHALQYVAVLVTCLPFTRTQEPAMLANLASALVSRRGDTVVEDVKLWLADSTNAAPVPPQVVQKVTELAALVLLLRMAVNLRMLYDLKASAVASLSTANVTKSSETVAVVPSFPLPPLKPLALPAFFSRYAAPRLADSAVVAPFAQKLVQGYATLVKAAASEHPSLPGQLVGGDKNSSVTLGGALQETSGPASPPSAGNRIRGRKRAAGASPSALDDTIEGPSSAKKKRGRAPSSAQSAGKSANGGCAKKGNHNSLRNKRRASTGYAASDGSDDDFVP